MKTVASYAPRHSRGLATIEFAICAPLLLLLMFATAEIGRLLYQYNTLTKAVRDGARFAVGQFNGSTRVIIITPEVRAQTRNLVVSGNVAGSGSPLLPGLAVDDVRVTNDANGFVSVSADFTFTPVLTSLPTFGLGDPINLARELTATVVMRAL
jgi:Flp pilus assembly protein TadG